MKGNTDRDRRAQQLLHMDISELTGEYARVLKDEPAKPLRSGTLRQGMMRAILEREFPGESDPRERPVE